LSVIVTMCDQYVPHRGQPPCRGGGYEPTKSWPNLWEQICYMLPVLLCWFRLYSRLWLHSHLFMASQLFTAL